MADPLTPERLAAIERFCKNPDIAWSWKDAAQDLLAAYKALQSAATASHERAERYFSEQFALRRKIAESCRHAGIASDLTTAVDIICEQLAALTPKWTTEKPTTPGWYWAKTDDDNYEPEVVLRDTNGMLWLSGEYESLIYTQFTHFAGPLPEPEDA